MAVAFNNFFPWVKARARDRICGLAIYKRIPVIEKWWTLFFGIMRRDTIRTYVSEMILKTSGCM